jgi:GABA(A) receptor-associated protein
MSSFKEKFCKDNTLQQRKNESSKILKKFTNKLPVVISEGDSSIVLDKHKYLVPRDITVGQLLYVIRQRIECISSEKALYLSVKNTMATSRTELYDIYEQYKDEDGFLYFSVFSENTFG